MYADLLYNLCSGGIHPVRTGSRSIVSHAMATWIQAQFSLFVDQCLCHLATNPLSSNPLPYIAIG